MIPSSVKSFSFFPAKFFLKIRSCPERASKIIPAICTPGNVRAKTLSLIFHPFSNIIPCFPKNGMIKFIS